MEINPTIFKAYDIRGVVPDDLDPEVITAIARAFARFISVEYGIEHPAIILARDVRASSPEFADAAKRGLVEGGGHVTDVGITTTPMFYWISGSSKADGGLIITASHNPPQWNGAKFVGRRAAPFAKENCFSKLQELIQSGERANKPGTIAEKDFLDAYVGFVAENFAFKLLKIVIDGSNGPAGIVLEKLFSRFPEISVVPLYWQPDGTFPNHDPDPLIDKNCAPLMERVKREGADLGAIIDGDGDRVRFVNENGELIGGDFITALIGEARIKERGGGAVVYDFRSSRSVPEAIEHADGKAIPSRVGHFFIKQHMSDSNAIFGGEVSGHYYYPENFFAENSMLTILNVLSLMSASGKKLSELIAPFDRYERTGEINFPVQNWPGLLADLAERYKDASPNLEDGITVTADEAGFNIRPSNTEPLVRLNLEAKDQQTLKEKLSQLSEIIKQY